MKSKKKSLTYIGIMLIIAPILYYLIISKGDLYNAYPLVLALMWLPAFAGILTKLIYDHSLKGMGLGIKIKSIKYILFAYILPPIACLVVYGFTWVFGFGGVTPIPIAIIIALATSGVLSSCYSAMGEEIGWRGFLLNDLIKHYSFAKTSIIIGIIWYIYHVPLILFSNYNNGSQLYSMIFFFISIMSVTVIANYISLKSESVWPAVMIHASHNLFVQGVFDMITINTGITKYITTEFGAGLAIVYSLVAIYILFKLKREGKLTNLYKL